MGLTAYLKATNFCHVGCEHCYLPEETRANKDIMSQKTLEETAHLLLDLARKEGHPTIHVVWHGGEPLMISPEWYESAGKTLEHIIGKGRFTESIQTSLIPYKSKWKNLIDSRYGGCIGSSVDFSQRKIKSSPDAYLDLFMKKVNNARNDGLYIIPGMVPTKNEIGKGKAIVDWFVENDFDEFNIERYSKVGVGSIDWPSNKQHSMFLIDVFDAVLKRLNNGKPAPYVKAIVSGILGVLYNLPGDRWGGACQKEFLVIEPDGSTNSCPDRARHEKPFSNVADGAEAFALSEQRRGWIRVQNITHKENHCITCEYRTWCKSGCPVTPNGPSHKQDECSGYKTFLNHVKAVCEDNEQRVLLENYCAPLGQQIIQEFEII
jgi:radical SAM protein with 4Fe4S-binding SPASM domain